MTMLGMTKLSRSTVIGCLVFAALLALAMPSWAQARPPIAAKIARTYGLNGFGKVDAIRYTFNVERDGKVVVSRTWTWEPKTDQVSYEGKDKDGNPVKVTYLRSQVDSQPDNVKNEIDPNFFNDQYWLLYPLHVSWDDSATVQDLGVQKMPLGSGSARHVVVKYPSDGGFSPGDTWELFVGRDNRVEQFIYRRGGPKKPAVVTTTWAGYKKAGPLLIATDHRGNADGNPLRIFFSDVAVKLAGSDKWVAAR